MKGITFRLAIAILTFLIGVVVAAWCTVRHYGPNNVQREADCIPKYSPIPYSQAKRAGAQYSIDSMRCLSKSSLLASMKVIDWFGSRHFMLRSPFGSGDLARSSSSLPNSLMVGAGMAWANLYSRSYIR